MARPSGRRTAQFPLRQAQPQPQVPSMENNFTQGLKTEYTGLNFPENACTSTSNCTFTRVGNVTRRNGFDYESNFTSFATSIASLAVSTFVWTNAGGDGNTIIYVVQIGSVLYFYQISNATIARPASTTKLASTVNISSFVALGGNFDSTKECQYTAGNGYLFVFHPDCDPFFCTDINGVVTGNVINIAFRDFAGITEPGVADNFRPTTLSAEHQYNLINQGWTSGAPWTANFANPNVSLPLSSPFTFTITSQTNVTSVVNGSQIVVNITNSNFSPAVVWTVYGTVTSYVTPFTSITISISSQGLSAGTGLFNTSGSNITASLSNVGFISAWFTAIGNYPSNSDIWWTFKNASNVFAPATTAGNVQLTFTPAPKGSLILNTFNQDRSSAANVQGLTKISTNVRPKTGTFYAGRVWYTGIDASFPPSGDEPFYTWAENIYFSQVIQNTSQFGKCYQTNDPTSQELSALLPTDGGVIQIQGAGSIHKLFPVLNGIIVFATNGIWFITGGTSIGFTATDFTISKVSGEHCLSGSSFIEVLGYPVFWNADGIYSVQPGQSLTSGQRALEVKNMTLPTIKQFYQSIPLSSKLYARGSYNHITGVIQWLYKSVPETGVENRYQFDSILNFLTYTEAFYPWTVSSGNTILAIDYIENTGQPSPSTAYPPLFKYFTNTNLNTLTFSEEKDNVNWEDWFTSGSPVSYTSSFTTGYKLKGQGQRKFQPQYVYLFSEVPTYAYTIQGLWSYAGDFNSNKFTSRQTININKQHFLKNIRKHRLRGIGYVMQYEITSVTGKPFNIAGWSVLDLIGSA